MNLLHTLINVPLCMLLHRIINSSVNVLIFILSFFSRSPLNFVYENSRHNNQLANAEAAYEHWFTLQTQNVGKPQYKIYKIYVY